MTEITLHLEKYTLAFASAHFLPGFGKCDRLHGHNYNLRVEVRGDIGENDALIDFTKLKEVVQKIIAPLDHKILVATESEIIKVKDESEETNVEITAGDKHYSFPRDDIFFLPLRATTCEQLSIFFHAEIKKQFQEFKIRVEIEETPGSTAVHADQGWES